MPKPSDDIQDLKRRLAHLARLEGRALACAEGAILLEPRRVRDPRPLVEACLAGRPPLAAVEASLELASPPVPLNPRLLAGAQRDLRVLETAPALVALTREAPRIFRRYGEIDAAWIARKRARLARLAEVMGAEDTPGDGRSGAHPPWFRRVLDVVRFLHGEAGCEAVEQALARLFKDEEGHRRELRREFDELVACLEGRRAPRTESTAEAVRALREAGSLPGRSRARKVLPLLAHHLGLPPLHEGPSLDRSLPLVPLVRTFGEDLLARVPSPRSATFQEQARRFFALYALAFAPQSRDGAPLSLSRAVVEEGLKQFPQLLKRFGGRKLTVAEALLLNRMKLGRDTETIASLVDAGLPIEKVRTLAALGRAEDLAKLAGHPETAAAYADWAGALVPHYSALGLDLPLTPEVFARLRVPRREDLAVLAVCLMKHHARTVPEAAEQALARLDTTLGLFRRRPEEAASLVAELSGTSPGAGREAFPEFAAWLGDDALLDRFVHLSRLADLPLTLSQRLRADFDREERLAREHAHLLELGTRSAAQEERLARLAAGAVATADPLRTRRRLADRNRELTALAYERRLDAVFLRILKEVWGISLPRLTPGWRDAIRFYLAVEDNRELLGTLLRAAAAGTDVVRTLPKNRAWLAEARLHFDVEAWLAPRSREVTLGGKPYRLAVEQDPIEVLRMGIPFDTCLALETGSNAASTVVNAADANKLVIYLRDARGQIIARKLLAVSEEYQFLGYRLYIAESTHREAISQLFQAFCGELAAAARLPLASAGKPRILHPGFWYDDGVVSEADVEEAAAPVQAWCESLGLSPPRVVTEALRRDARVFGALSHGDEARVLAALRDSWRVTGIRGRAAEWLRARLPPERLLEEARHSSALAAVAIRHAAKKGAGPMLELGGRLADWRGVEETVDQLGHFPRTVEVAQALIHGALTSKRHSPRFDDHGLEHQSVYLLPSFVAELPIAASFELCDRVEPLWRWIAQVAPACEDCVQSGEALLIEALVRRYASARDPATVLRYLEQGRVSRLARRVALHLAARYALCEDATAPTLPPPRPEPLRPAPAALRALTRLRKREPELDAEPEMRAALLRQSAGGPLPHGSVLPVPEKAPFAALGDLEPIAQAFACIDRAFAGQAEPPEAVSSALKALQKAALPWLSYQPIVARLLARSSQGLSAEECAFIGWCLRERTTYHHPELSPEWVVTLWQVKALRRELVGVLGKSEERFFSSTYGYLQSAAQRLGGASLLDGLFEAVVEECIAQGTYEALAHLEDEALFLQALRQALEGMSVAAAIALYKDLSDFEQAALLLRELSRSPLVSSEAFGTQVAMAQASWPEWSMPLDWLQQLPSLGKTVLTSPL